MASQGGWVEEAWCDSPLGGGGLAASVSSNSASAGGDDSGGQRGSSLPARHDLIGDEDVDTELDPWGGFLTLDTSGVDPVEDSRRQAANPGAGGALTAASELSLRSGLSSLVQMGQQLVRQHEEQGRGVVRSLWRSLDSLQHLQPGLAAAPPRLGGTGGSSSASDPLARPLLAVQAGESQLGSDGSSSGPSSSPPNAPLRESERSSGTAAAPGTVSHETATAPPSFWGLWPTALLPGSREQGEAQGFRGRGRSGGAPSASTGSPASRVVPLRPSIPRGARAFTQAPTRSFHEQHGPEGCAVEEEEEEDAEAALMKEEMLRIGRPLRAHWRWGDGGGGRHDRHTCLHKSMEVLPVLAVVAFLVLGTVAYFTIVDRVLAQFKAPFSLSCSVELGSWVQRPSPPVSSSPTLTFAAYNPQPEPAPDAPAAPPLAGGSSGAAPSEASGLYTGSCPFIRDEFNCAKYGLPAQAGLAWQPQSCQLSPVKPIALLRLLRNRGIAFVGDMTVANQFDSFICQLAQQENPVRLRASQGSGQGAEHRSRGLQEAVPQPLPSAMERRALGGLGAGPRERSPGSGGERRGSESDTGVWDFWPFASTRTGRSRASAPSGVAGGRDGSSSSGAEISDASEGEEAAWELAGSAPGGVGGANPAAARRNVLLFPAHNVTVAFYHSPFLVRADVRAHVNASACQQSKASALQEGGRAREVPSSSELRAMPGRDPSHNAIPNNGTATPPTSPNEGAVARIKAVEARCYPNTIELAEPDVLWASEAQMYDVMVLSSGRAWTEEAVERLGLGIAEGGRRAGGLSVEGLQGQWAFPRAMASVARWLDNSSNFAGTAVFRSFSPHHVRKDCASRALLSATSEAFSEEYKNSFERYNDALGDALYSTRHLFLNVTALSWERADGHPWMSSPARPRADCGNWCLPGVPDTWNQILGNMIVQLLRTRDG